MKISKYNSHFLSLTLVLLFMPTISIAAEIDSTINTETQIGKTLRFNDFFEKELTRSEKKLAFNEYYETYLAQRAESIQERPELRHLIDLSVGHDRNTSFGPDRKGDFFQEQRIISVLDKLIAPHPLDETQLIQFQPEGGFYWKDYFDENQLDALVWSAGASVLEKGNKPVKLSAKYNFSRIRYPSNAPITQSSHTANVFTTWTQNTTTEHQSIILLEWKSYDERKALQDNAVFSDEARKDFRYGFGYQLNHQFNGSVALYLSSLWSRNDSNDLFLNYNDYESIANTLSSVIYLSDKWTQVFYGGVDYKEYDDRVFVFDSTKPQLDRVYFTGCLTEYRVSKNASLILSYRYTENTSTNVSQDYSDSNLKLTTRFIF